MENTEQNLPHTGKPDSFSNDPRIYLAAERTFLSWIRTGLALMGFGFVVARFGLFLHEFAQNNTTNGEHHTGFSLPVGVALIGMGILVNVIAAFRHHCYVRAIDAGHFRQSFGSAFAFRLRVCSHLLGWLWRFISWRFCKIAAGYTLGWARNLKDRDSPPAPARQPDKPNAFPPSDEGKAKVRVNRKSNLWQTDITPLLFDSYHE